MEIRKTLKFAVLFTFFHISFILNAQPNPDLDFVFELNQRAYIPGTGPLITIDEGHNNLHTKEGGLLPLVNILISDGYKVSANLGEITLGQLSETDIYVIVNPLHDSDVGNWVVPNPSAFSDDEIKALANWVKKGGKLLLVADHMPYGGAAQKLGMTLGVDWNNGFAIKEGQNWPPSVFSRESGTLKSTQITDGRKPFEKVDEIASFTGSVFKAPKGAEVFMVYDGSHDVFMPDTAWQFNKNTKTLNSVGWQQGASFEFGKGKVVVLGEAAMITAQIVNNNFKVGINSPQAPENAQLALNIFHYLSDHQEYVNLDDILDANLKSMEDAFRTGDMQAVANWYADDARIFGPNGNDQTGRAEIDRYWGSISGMQVDWKLTSIERKEVGSEIHEIGTSELTYMSSGTEVTATSRFYLIWKLVDGKYLIAMDFYHIFR